MHVAVVIPAFNAADFLPEAIRSVVAQSHADWSAMVVDDGSTDATAAVAAHFQDKRIDLIRQANAGVSAARNAGLRAAFLGRPLPDAVLFLDADDWLAPDAVSHLAKALQDAPRAVASVARFARVGLGCAARAARSPPTGALLERLLIRNLFANGGHVLIRRQAVEAAGPFRSDLSYGEDWEYWTRLALLGDFAPVQAAAAMLFVRERLDGAYLSRAADPESYRAAMAAIYGNPVLAERVGANRLMKLVSRCDAEMAWTVGRECIRRGCRREGLGWLYRSLRGAPSAKRLALLGLVWLRLGPYHAY